jgi:hypothetical protein
MFVDFYKVINFGLRLSNASEDDNLDEQTAALYVFFFSFIFTNYMLAHA